MADSLRDKTARLRREHVLAAATRVFAERGFHRTTIRDVAVAAGVSDGAIYKVFENKDALLLGMVEPLGRNLAHVEERPAPTEISALIKGLVTRRLEEFTPETLAGLRVVLSEVLVDADLRELFVARVIAPVLTLPEPAFVALAADGQLGPTDIPMTLRLVAATVLGMTVLRLLGDEYLEEGTDELPAALSAFLLDGLRSKRTEETDGPA